MPNTESNFNPAYSTIQSITLAKEDGEGENLVITQFNTSNNTVCRFERIEMVENINDMCPSGVLLVTDLSDIVSYVANNKLEKVFIKFLNGNIWEFDITSISYVNNAVSVGEDTLVSIHFTNKWYKKFSTNSLNDLLGYKKPQVFKINDFIKDVKEKAFEIPLVEEETEDTSSLATNYFLYKPFNPYNDGEEHLSDSVMEMMNYVASFAVDQDFEPNFFFWTSLDSSVNFKSFKRIPGDDPSEETIDDEYRRIGVFEGDSVIQELSDGKFYRKAYFLATNPVLQWISKNYYYIRKTPKYLDGLTGACAASENIKNLMYHFQDEGQKYNIDVVTVDGRNGVTGAPKGGECLVTSQGWGYYDKNLSPNYKSLLTHASNQFGIDSVYSKMPIMGQSGYMPYLDTPDMWKNMFNLTPIHPHYPNTVSEAESFSESDISGSDTNLQKVIDIRYKVFENAGVTGASGDNLELLRTLELQNFVLYSLCCMGKKEDCFFAALTKYEEDNSITQDQSSANIPKKYRYKWNKLEFGGSTGSSGYCACGNSGSSGSSGSTGAHILENWCLNPYVKSSEKQDETWAINVNERGLTTSQSLSYLPPGWLPVSTSSSFYYRPIGAKMSPPGKGLTGENIYHIVRLCKETVDANNTVYYFWAENVLDGTCQQVPG